MAELPKALQFLADLQREADPGLDPHFPLPETERSKRKLEEYAKTVNPGFAPDIAFDRHDIPAGQSFIDYQILSQYKSDFDRAISKKFEERHRYCISEQVYFGTVESRTFNALITSVPNSDDYLVVLNRGLWESIGRISGMLSDAVVSNHEGILEFDEGRSRTHAKKFCSLIDYLISHYPLLVQNPELRVGSRPEVFWCEIDDAMHAFVFGHEYAHFLHGHFDGSVDLAESRSIGAIACKCHTTSWSNEYEADRTGLDLSVFRSRERHSSGVSWIPRLNKVAWNEGIIRAVQGCLLFLTLLCRLERLKSLIFYPHSAHPPTWLRLAAMWGILGQQIPPPMMRTVQERHIDPLLICLEYWFHLIDPPDNADIQLERRLQDAVFGSIFKARHVEIVRALEVLHQRILAQCSGFPPDDGSTESALVREWRAILAQPGNPPPPSAEREAMVSNCLAIMRTNASLLSIPI